MIDELNIEHELELYLPQDVIEKIYNHLEHIKDYLDYLQYHLENIVNNNADIKIPTHLSYFLEDIKKHNDIIKNIK
jgi:transcriptional regulatory protein LevR